MEKLEAISIILCVTGLFAVLAVKLANKLLMDQLDRTALLEKQISELNTRVAILEHDVEIMRKR